jgi:hypothetical protein
MCDLQRLNCKSKYRRRNYGQSDRRYCNVLAVLLAWINPGQNQLITRGLADLAENHLGIEQTTGLNKHWHFHSVTTILLLCLRFGLGGPP